MQNTCYRPWTFVDGLSREVMRRRVGPQFNHNRQQGWTPAVDIRENADRFVLQADLPGVEPDKIEVSTDDGVLKIKGSRQTPATDGDASVKRRERTAGDFERIFRLPDTADIARISASHRHGVLEIRIPKKPQDVARKIEVAH